ncbi:MAG: TonB-dependent siderophore receptor [Desmonostoc vinosum HA7617-LM4]|jgi:iron complex outermembrane receptor protein|nr:TonB-dependent siderophore receptor [Desmonostoc vinosum HA7617-LM4]
MSKQTFKIFSSRLEWLLIFAIISVVQPAKAQDHNSSPTPSLEKQRQCVLARVGYCLSQAGNDSSVQVTGVKANPTDKGVEVILQTSQGQQLQITNQNMGNSFIADIPNAQLRLANGEAFTFRSEKPLAGITEITVTNIDANTIRVTVIGEASVPVVELFDSPDEGLIFSVASTVPATPQPSEETQQTQPEQPTSQEDETIELVVTGEQDGYRVGESSTATRTDTPLRDVPQSIQIIPRQVIEDQKITRISDAVRNVSGVSPLTDFSGSFDSYTIRGFENFNILRNGFKTQPSYIYGANIERVEVLKGPASVLYGQFEPGGIVNYVTKQPLNNPYYAAGLTVGSYDFYNPSIDISGPLTDDKRLLYRLNVAYENAGSFRDFIDNKVFSISPVFTYKLSDATTLGFEYAYVNLDNGFDRGLRPNRISFDLPISRNLGDPNLDFYRQENHQVIVNVDHRFNENLRLKSGFYGYFSSEETDYVNPGDDFDADGRLLRQFEDGDGPGQQNDLSWQTDLIGKFKTGSIEHQLLVGLELSRSSRRYAGFGGAEDIPALDIFNPVYGGFPRPTNFTRGNFFDATTDTVGIYLQDQVTLLSNLKLLLGGRYDFVNYKSKFDFETLDRSNIQEDNFYDEAFSPRVGIVYQPIEPISLYASFSRSFVPNNNSSTASGSPLEPSRGTQYEVGVKAEISPQFSVTLAAYEITKTNVPTTDPEDDNFSIALGEVKSRGIELDMTGEILPGWKVIASAYVNDAFISKDSDTTLEGSRFANTAQTGASLWTTYEIQKGDFQGLGFGTGIFYVGDRIANQSDPFTLPAYVRADAAIFYKRDNWRLGLNFKNLGNVKAYDTNGYLVFPQAPFTVLGTVSIEF